MDTLINAKDMTINERVRYLRKKILKITQLELGEVCGVGGTAIAKLEKGGSTVTKRNIKTKWTTITSKRIRNLNRRYEFW